MRRFANDGFGNEWDEVFGLRGWAGRPVLGDGIVERIPFEQAQCREQDEAGSAGRLSCREQVEDAARGGIERQERVLVVWTWIGCGADDGVDLGRRAGGRGSIARVTLEHRDVMRGRQRAT